MITKPWIFNSIVDIVLSRSEDQTLHSTSCWEPRTKRIFNNANALPAMEDKASVRIADVLRMTYFFADITLRLCNKNYTIVYAEVHRFIVQVCEGTKHAAFAINWYNSDECTRDFDHSLEYKLGNGATKGITQNIQTRNVGSLLHKLSLPEIEPVTFSSSAHIFNSSVIKVVNGDRTLILEINIRNKHQLFYHSYSVANHRQYIFLSFQSIIIPCNSGAFFVYVDNK